ncbi:MAG: type II toxin-antitoxin system prevent-host-death family antitoxin [Acidobacteria bacterium]|nr:type II toxin-antitoxin system prevent-host-death family antitoxin [Acidobacteriota bacterium]
MEQLNAEEAQRRLPELLRRAADGERIVIHEEGRSLEIVRAVIGDSRAAKARSLEAFLGPSALAGLDLNLGRDPDSGRDIPL